MRRVVVRQEFKLSCIYWEFSVCRRNRLRAVSNNDSGNFNSGNVLFGVSSFSISNA
jgi:hypothetical protein